MMHYSTVDNNVFFLFYWYLNASKANDRKCSIDETNELFEDELIRVRVNKFAHQHCAVF